MKKGKKNMINIALKWGANTHEKKWLVKMYLTVSFWDWELCMQQKKRIELFFLRCQVVCRVAEVWCSFNVTIEKVLKRIVRTYKPMVTSSQFNSFTIDKLLQLPAELNLAQRRRKLNQLSFNFLIDFRRNYQLLII